LGGWAGEGVIRAALKVEHGARNPRAEPARPGRVCCQPNVLSFGLGGGGG
jgi:hypothetical protein